MTQMAANVTVVIGNSKIFKIWAFPMKSFLKKYTPSIGTYEISVKKSILLLQTHKKFF